MHQRSIHVGRRWAPILGTVLILAGCGGAAAPSTSPSPAGLVDLAPTSRTTPRPTSTPRPTPTPTPRPTPTATPTSTRDPIVGQTGHVVVPQQGFAMTMPKGFTRLTLNAAALDQMAGLFTSNSDMGRVMSAQMTQLLAAGVKLWAIDASVKAGAGTMPASLNVIVQPARSVALSKIKALAVAELEAVGGISKVKATDVKLPAGPSVRVSYQATFDTTIGLTLQVQGIQYYLEAADNAYIVTFSCAKADSLCSDRAAKAMKSFEILP